MTCVIVWNPKLNYIPTNETEEDFIIFENVLAIMNSIKSMNYLFMEWKIFVFHCKYEKIEE